MKYLSYVLVGVLLVPTAVSAMQGNPLKKRPSILQQTKNAASYLASGFMVAVIATYLFKQEKNKQAKLIADHNAQVTQLQNQKIATLADPQASSPPKFPNLGMYSFYAHHILTKQAKF
jgi:hypothetical protein